MNFLKKLGIEHRFYHETKMAGKNLLVGFLQCHPALPIRKAQVTSLARPVGFNQGQVIIFFNIYKELLTEHEYRPGCIWNTDETGIEKVQTPAKIVATKGAHTVGRMASGERGKLVTVLCAYSAVGTYIPPLFVFPCKRMAQGLMNNAPSGAIGT